MLNKAILAIALTLSITAAASAATRHDRRGMENQAQTYASQPADDVLFDRAKGGIDY